MNKKLVNLHLFSLPNTPLMSLISESRRPLRTVTPDRGGVCVDLQAIRTKWRARARARSGQRSNTTFWGSGGGRSLTWSHSHSRRDGYFRSTLLTYVNTVINSLLKSFIRRALSPAARCCVLQQQIRTLIRYNWHFEDKFDRLCTFHLVNVCECVRIHNLNVGVFSIRRSTLFPTPLLPLWGGCRGMRADPQRLALSTFPTCAPGGSLIFNLPPPITHLQVR